jgi:hypothetical protein
VSSSADRGHGPWPEPDEPDRAPSIAGGETPEWDPPAERDDVAGSRGVSLAIAGLNVIYLMFLPVLLVVGIYTYLTVYAIVKAVDGGSDSPDPATVLIGIVGLVTVFVVALGLGSWAIGRTADPRKRRR